ncbi:MAG: GNAT family N-acetyltransferase, partial [Candidatus Kariarchaeaceae archaeon]
MYYGQKTVLRGLELSDVDKIMAHFNNLELRKNLLTAIPFSENQEIEWIKRTWQQMQNGSGYTFAVTTSENQFIGTASLEGIHPVHRSASLGIALYPKKYWDKGFGTDACITLCGVGFNLLNINRIELEYHDFNKRGERVYQKIGFKHVGIRRKTHFIEGEYHDSVLMDILRE